MSGIHFFISGMVTEHDRVRALHRQLSEAGHTCSFDWTAADQIRGLNPGEINGSCAESKLVGIEKCDVFIYLDHPQVRDGLIELGAALASANTVQVLWVSTEEENSHFSHSAQVVRLTSDREVLPFFTGFEHSLDYAEAAGDRAFMAEQENQVLKRQLANLQVARS